MKIGGSTQKSKGRRKKSKITVFRSVVVFWGWNCGCTTHVYWSCPNFSRVPTFSRIGLFCCFFFVPQLPFAFHFLNSFKQFKTDLLLVLGTYFGCYVFLWNKMKGPWYTVLFRGRYGNFRSVGIRCRENPVLKEKKRQKTKNSKHAKRQACLELSGTSTMCGLSILARKRS